jgi:hypothetical protein
MRIHADKLKFVLQVYLRKPAANFSPITVADSAFDFNDHDAAAHAFGYH